MNFEFSDNEVYALYLAVDSYIEVVKSYQRGFILSGDDFGISSTVNVIRLLKKLKSSFSDIKR